MSLTRRSRRGFSLTEILMAVGILGIGLTMVASIFPVAVDQTRRANESTMAALCARSAAATIRATRTSFVNAHRNYFRATMTSADANVIYDRERPAEFGVLKANADLTITRRNPGLVSTTADTIIAKNMRVYNPNMFLYEAGRRYETTLPTALVENEKFWPMWNAGNYVPVIYVTPIVPPDKRTQNDAATTAGAAVAGIYNHSGGPWRVTIVIFKSRGTTYPSTISTSTSYPDGDRLHPRTKSWYQNARPDKDTTWVKGPSGTGSDEPTFIAGGGNYVIDRTRHSGECYMIDFAHTDLQKTVAGVAGNDITPPIFLACGNTASGVQFAFATPTLAATSATTAAGMWYPLPGAIAAFHTIIGD
jgi:prepilin-type N-terminal cleavage/methylation domain-containing protein